MPMRRALWLAMALISVAGCSDSSSPPVPPSEDPVVSVQIVPAMGRVAEHGELRVAAVTLDARGRVTTQRELLWNSLDPQVALITPDLWGDSASVRAIVAGTARIVVRAEDIRDTVSVTVTPLPVDHVVITSTLADTVLLRARGQVIAYPYAADGLPLTRTVTYASVRPGVATVSADGHVEIVGSGTGGVIATSEGKSATDEFHAMTATFTAISSGHDSDCAIATDRQLWCWGAGLQLGRPDMYEAATPVPVLSAYRFNQVSTGRSHACGLIDGDVALCWGAAFSGELGGGEATGPAGPTVVQGHRFSSVSAGASFTCATDIANVGFCWGDNTSQQLGNSDALGAAFLPTRALADTTFRMVRTGVRNACGINTVGQAICWGDASQGQTGGVPAGEPVPGYSFSDISVGDESVCGLTPAGVAVCWGSALFGATGDGGTNPAGTPAPVVGGLTFAHIAVGKGFGCGVTTAGRIYCWGEGWSGALGNGSKTNVNVPTPIASSETFSTVSAGLFHACGLTTAGALWCWGSRASTVGGLGDGGHSPSPVPVRIPGS